MKTTATRYLHCPLCGYEFEKRDTPCERGCPLGRFCNLTCCPNCRYEFPDETRAFAWLRRVLHRRKPLNGERTLFCLPELDEGEQSELVCLNCAHASRRNALIVYGLIPGSRLVLQQKRPAVVVRVGETELALEPSIACDILVKRVK